MIRTGVGFVRWVALLLGGLLIVGATAAQETRGAAATTAPQEQEEPAQETEQTEEEAAQETEQTEQAAAEPTPEQSEPARRGSLPGVAGTFTDEEEAALRLVDQILREQQFLHTGANFVYQSEGRRDPFRSLVLLRQRELTAPEDRPAGLPGFLINEIAVQAVARYQGRWHAMVMGLDRRTYFADVGTQLYDGRIVEINDEQVVFEQEVEDMLGARSNRRVVRRLNPGTEE